MVKKGKFFLFIFLIIMFILIFQTSIFAERVFGTTSYGGYGNAGSFIRQGSNDLVNFIVDWAEPFLIAVFGGGNYTGALVFEKFLFFLLILSIVYLSIKRVDFFKDQTFVIWTISIIMPLLAVRYLDLIWVNTLLVEYQILGIAVVGILPFLVYFFFVNRVSESSYIRKIAWIFFIVIYFFLWTTSEESNYGEIYFWTMLVAFVFLILDGTIHRAMIKKRFEEADKLHIAERIADLDEKIQKMEKSDLHPRDKNRSLKAYREEKDRLLRYYGGSRA